MDEQGNGQDDTSGAADDGDGGSGDPRFDALARRAGQALRRPAPAHGIDDVRRGRRRQQLVRVGVGGVACLVLALGAVAITRGDDERGQITPVTTPDTTPDTAPDTTPDTTGDTTPDTLPPDTAPPPFTSDTVIVPGVAISADTMMAWGGGYLLGVLIDGQFLPYGDTSGIPAEMIDAEVTLLDRSFSTDTWTVLVDPCGQPSIRPAPSSPLFGQDLAMPMNWSENYLYPGTLDGAADEDLTALRAVLVAQYGSAEGFELVTPTESMDGDPELETLVRRYITTTDPTDPFTQTWLAVWDPTDSSLTTLRGDPVDTAQPFRMSGEGPTNVNGDEFWEDLIVTPSGDVSLIQLNDGTVLASAGECRS